MKNTEPSASVATTTEFTAKKSKSILIAYTAAVKISEIAGSINIEVEVQRSQDAAAARKLGLEPDRRRQ